MEAPPSIIESRKFDLFKIKQIMERMEPTNAFSFQYEGDPIGTENYH
jgi:hypothetical protein